MIDLLDRLYAAGLIHKNFPSDDQEGTKAYLVYALSVNPPIVWAVLEKFVKEDTDAAEASANPHLRRAQTAADGTGREASLLDLLL